MHPAGADNEKRDRRTQLSESNAATEAEATPEKARMAIRKIYLKDLSFESPVVPEIFTGEGVRGTSMSKQDAAA